jgi:hypothetical protein
MLERHLEALRTSSRLTGIFRRMYEPMAARVKPEKVIAVLHEAGVNCVLMGTHGIGGYRSEPRATQDVDVLVSKRDLPRTLRALRASYPNLVIMDNPVVARFVDPKTGKPAIDVMKPTQPVYQLAFRHTVPIGDTHRIPDLEMALVSKFAAMVSPNRAADKKMIDGGDFINIVRHNRAEIDLAKLKGLAQKVYPHGGAEILRMINDVDAGRTLEL